ncbi:prolyl-tRNA synthetase [Coprinopsis sp. MPI-PUGE-AT-0042]|nr:prolyl-tRNA synthetase [Coprinopsis sp. MPI-PUGE-AT-0042]
MSIAIGVKKGADFASWCSNVLLKADMMDYSVSGCYILKPWSYSVWKEIQSWFNTEIKKLGVQNSYFPMFVSQSVLEREKDHIEGFSPEVAWVTRAGKSDLEEPIVILYEDLLAVPIIPGVKSEKEKFAGGLYITTLEGFIPTSGRGIQAATSHCLGHNFSKPEMFNIFVEDPVDKSKHYVCVQAVIVPCGITAKTSDEQRAYINNACEELARTLRKAGVRIKADLRDGMSPTSSHGVPLRLEIGPKDLAKKQTMTVRCHTGVKNPVPLDNICSSISSILETIQADMLATATNAYWDHVKTVTEWDDVVPALDAKNIVVIPWCESEACGDIKDRSGRSAEHQDERAPSAGAKSLCIPFDQSHWPAIEPGKTKCTGCGNDAKRWTLFGRSY